MGRKSKLLPKTASVYSDKGSFFMFVLRAWPRVSRNSPVIYSRATGALAAIHDGQCFEG